jgi:hypothetical protein
MPRHGVFNSFTIRTPTRRGSDRPKNQPEIHAGQTTFKRSGFLRPVANAPGSDGGAPGLSISFCARPTNVADEGPRLKVDPAEQLPST